MRVIRTYLWAILVLQVSACSSLPAIAPATSRIERGPKVESARGPISERRNQAVLRGLRENGRPSSLLERHLAFEQSISDSPLLIGNDVRLLQDGPDTYQAMFAAIQSAGDHINMETYILEDDEVGRHFAAALIEKQRKGVQVNLIYDSVGSLSTSAEFFKLLADAGVALLEFNPVDPKKAKLGWNLNHRDHRKLLIIDGKTAFLGGLNISSVYSGSSFNRRPKNQPSGRLPRRDTHLMVQGPVVAQFQKLFMQTWVNQQGENLSARAYFPALAAKGNDIVHAIGSAPGDPLNLIYATLISAIDAAQNEVLLTNAYFVPDRQLIESLKAAVRRGAHVSLILPAATDSVLVYYASRSNYDELLQAGVNIYERKQALLHSKTAVIDGVWATVGSGNLDWRSFVHNQEVLAVVLGAEFGARMRSVFADDREKSMRIAPEAWQQRPVNQRLKEAFSRLWQYWL